MQLMQKMKLTTNLLEKSAIELEDEI